MSDLNASVDMFEETSNQEGINWKGTPLDELRPKHICTYPAIRSTPTHTVLFKLPIPNDGPLEPHPTRPADKWDSDHVRMPHSPESLFPVSENQLESRWDLIKTALNKPIKSSADLEQTILSYNIQSGNESSFGALHTFFDEVNNKYEFSLKNVIQFCIDHFLEVVEKTLLEEETAFYFDNLMPKIVKLALEVEDKFRGGLPILKRGVNRSISMSQVQAAVLLANAFLCTFPRRNSSSSQSNLPSINFNNLFQYGSMSCVQQKLKCFTNYFSRVIRNRPKGVVTYTRRSVKPSEIPNWSESKAKLSPLYISSSGTIEDDGGGMMEMDFANKLIGGGVLGKGSVQEEIRFLICPELVVARLFSEKMTDTEAIIITGCERFNKYSGYGQSFTWSGSYHDDSTRDAYRRLNTIVVAIDALYNFRFADQFKIEMIIREINKAYAGFSFGQEGAIATGNWGCGVYKGDPCLKFLLQLMAASVCGKPIAYFTFDDDELTGTLFKMHQFLVEKNVQVGDLWRMIKSYIETTGKGKNGNRLYEFIYNQLNSNVAMASQLKLGEVDSIDVNSHKRKYVTSDSSPDNRETDQPNPKETESLTTSTNQLGASNLLAKLRVDSPTGKTFVKSSKPSNEDSASVADERLTGATRQPLCSRKSASTPEKLNDSVDVPEMLGTSCSNREPVDADTCSLQTAEGRQKCLNTDKQRWEAYQSAMSQFGNLSKIDSTSPNSSPSSSSSSLKTKRGSTKRKISDYFNKLTP